MCGIFGVALKPGASRKAALQKVKILGLYNIKRGKDASGVYVNGEIIKGIGRISEFDDFIEDMLLPIPKENSVMLGHTRQGSWGYKKTIDEAHPFLINDDLVFTHNGTIKNVKELCEKYELKEADFSVDSQILGTILDNHGTEVLEKYTGAAALAFTRKGEENVLYLYHGKSKDYKYGQPLEERPLFFMETKDGLYYSSLEESLEAIRDTELDVPYNLKYNTVFKIENGKFIFAESVSIDREETNVQEYVTPVHQGKRSKALTTTTPPGTTGSAGKVGENTKNNSQGVSIIDDQLIKKESLPIKVLESKEQIVYYHQGRYWKTPRILLQGGVYIKKGNTIGHFDDKLSKLYFFWQGVMLQRKENYQELDRMNKNTSDRNWVRHPNEHNFALKISKYSIYPVCNIGVEAYTIGDYYRKIWYNNGSDSKNFNFTPMFSCGRNYKIERAHLTRITPSQRENTLWDTVKLAEDEVTALVNGTLLTGISGGDSNLLPFRVDSASTRGDQKDEDELVWFYDLKLVSLKQADEEIGEDELNALKTFTRITYKQDYNLEPEPEEVDEDVKSLILTAINKGCSIMDTIKDDMDKNLLEKTYDKIVEGRNKKDYFQSALGMKKIVEEKEKAIVNFDEIEVEEVEPEVLDDLVESSIVDMENMQTTSMELQAAEASDYAQDAAGVLLTGVDNMLSNLQGVLAKHKKSDFVERVKKIRETKSLKNGVI